MTQNDFEFIFPLFLNTLLFPNFKRQDHSNLYNLQKVQKANIVILSKASNFYSFHLILESFLLYCED